jgi:hypothetical protein
MYAQSSSKNALELSTKDGRRLRFLFAVSEMQVSGDLAKLMDRLCFIDAPLHALTYSAFQYSFPY